MSNFDFENFHDSDFEDKGDTIWHEGDWQSYLNQNSREIHRFTALYRKSKFHDNYLEDIATKMGWRDNEWAPREEPLTFDLPEPYSPNEDAQEKPIDPYTIHKHPVIVFTRGLYEHIQSCWEYLLTHSTNTISPIASWKFSSSIHDGDYNILMAINSIDIGDNALAVCHIKKSLSSVNKSLGIIQQISPIKNKTLDAFVCEIRSTLFDLREVWIRLLTDCRNAGNGNNFNDFDS